MIEVRVTDEEVERRIARRVEAGPVEREAVTYTGGDVSLGPERGARLGEGEVDIEENGANGHASSRSQRTVSMWTSQ